MPRYRYMPLLRTKSGEVAALENLAPSEKVRLFPVFHVVEEPPATFADRISAVWAFLPAALDGLFHMDQTGSGQQFLSIYDKMGQGGIEVVPSVICDAPAWYVGFIQPLINRYAPGLVINASLNQLGTAGAWAAAQGWNLSDADLIIDCKSVAGYDIPSYAPFVSHLLSSAAPSLTSWRSVTLASAAAPKDHSNLNRGRNVVPRRDWLLWQSVAPTVGFDLHYGDYGISHPDLTEPPGVAMVSATVSVRYTVDDAWVILKGFPTTGNTGKPMGAQYLKHAQDLASEPAFGGLPQCWGDWPAAGLMDTEIRCFHQLESQNAEKEVQPRVQA